MPSTHWQKNFNQFEAFRKALKEKWNWPKSREIHFQKFLTDKDPYHRQYSATERKEIGFEITQAITTLDIRIISTVIDKSKIKPLDYNVLDKALTYNIQRLENDMRTIQNHQHFLIITDEGRVGKMRATSRRMVRFNYIPSQFGGNYRDEIKAMIEDPLPKDSSESHFIQIADVVSTWVYLYAASKLCHEKVPWANRVKNVLEEKDAVQALEILKPKLNLKASKTNEYGIVCYPK